MDAKVLPFRPKKRTEVRVRTKSKARWVGPRLGSITHFTVTMSVKGTLDMMATFKDAASATKARKMGKIALDDALAYVPIKARHAVSLKIGGTGKIVTLAMNGRAKKNGKPMWENPMLVRVLANRVAMMGLLVGVGAE